MNRPSAIKECERLAMALFNHELISFPYGAADFYLRLTIFLLDLQVFFIDEPDYQRETLAEDAESLLEQYRYARIDQPDVLMYLDEMYSWLRQPRPAEHTERA